MTNPTNPALERGRQLVLIAGGLAMLLFSAPFLIWAVASIEIITSVFGVFAALAALIGGDYLVRKSPLKLAGWMLIVAGVGIGLWVLVNTIIASVLFNWIMSTMWPLIKAKPLLVSGIAAGIFFGVYYLLGVFTGNPFMKFPTALAAVLISVPLLVWLTWGVLPQDFKNDVWRASVNIFADENGSDGQASVDQQTVPRVSVPTQHTPWPDRVETRIVSYGSSTPIPFRISPPGCLVFTAYNPVTHGDLSPAEVEELDERLLTWRKSTHHMLVSAKQPGTRLTVYFNGHVPKGATWRTYTC